MEVCLHWALYDSRGPYTQIFVLFLKTLFLRFTYHTIFMCYEIHPFKVYSSVALIIFPELGKHQRNLNSECFITE